MIRVLFSVVKVPCFIYWEHASLIRMVERDVKYHSVKENPDHHLISYNMDCYSLLLATGLNASNYPYISWNLQLASTLMLPMDLEKSSSATWKLELTTTKSTTLHKSQNLSFS